MPPCRMFGILPCLCTTRSSHVKKKLEKKSSKGQLYMLNCGLSNKFFSKSLVKYCKRLKSYLHNETFAIVGGDY